MPQTIELLAPAKDKLTAIEAINCGADAIYMGAQKFGARYAASNSIDDICEVVNYAHCFNAKVYVTINTIIKDSEIAEVESLIRELYNIGVDALIIQDLGILNMNIPPIELHASTQCDISSVEKAKFLERLGFSQLVLARELSINQIKDICNNTSVPIEAFIHGALCVSYSGKCHASQVLKHRSANRGECAQICRMAFDLTDATGTQIAKQKYLLSLRDLNRSSQIKDMLDAGVTSFKIEGRLKDVGYVKNVVATYRSIIDGIISAYPNLYQRASSGESINSFKPNLYKSFNRGFTEYFFNAKVPDNASMASINTPKSTGEPIGIIKSVTNDRFNVETTSQLHNGDGISFFDSKGTLTGVRVNKVISDTSFIAYDCAIHNIASGTKIFRTFDKCFNDSVLQPSRRKLKLSFILSDSSLKATDELGNSYIYQFNSEFSPSIQSQKERQHDNLSKLGDTIFMIDSIQIDTDNFIPMSILAEARRCCVQKLIDAQREKRLLNTRNRRNSSNIDYNNNIYTHTNVTYKENVANKLAKQLYGNLGATNVQPALELESRKNTDFSEILIMTTKYCLRRELGICKKSASGRRFTDPLFLSTANNSTLKLEFDCNRCGMLIYSK